MDEENKENKLEESNKDQAEEPQESQAPSQDTQQNTQQDNSPKQQYYNDEGEEEAKKSYNSIMFRIKDFWRECVRVLKVTKKPDAMEYKSIVKVSGLGIIIIGLMGFAVQMLKVLFFG